MRRLFVSQELLDGWAEQGKIELSGSQLTILAENRSFELHPGAHFLSLAAGADGHRLVGKVKTESQIRELGAELYMNSVLLGEDAYDVQPGFVAEVADPPAPADAKASVQAATDAPERVSGRARTDPDLAAQLAIERQQVEEKAALARFLLENLT